MIGGRQFYDLFLNHIGRLNFTGGLDVLGRLILNQVTKEIIELNSLTFLQLLAVGCTGSITEKLHFRSKDGFIFW